MSNSSAATAFDFRKRVAYDDDAKRLFHHHARRQLRLLADALGLAPSSFDLRNNKGGIAVSGEVTMHGDHLYVQACQRKRPVWNVKASRRSSGAGAQPLGVWA